ncbi:hypothetical protein C4569_02360 [Candidatus Parcubacteria bacterium]|nr:MAG: hypothetical protein C4569_02360 [Candidatus Parcubacteria bacterium]
MTGKHIIKEFPLADHKQFLEKPLAGPETLRNFSFVRIYLKSANFIEFAGVFATNKRSYKGDKFLIRKSLAAKRAGRR